MISSLIAIKGDRSADLKPLAVSFENIREQQRISC